MVDILVKIDDVLYYPILIIVMGIAGFIFTFRTKFVQLRLLKESMKLVVEPPQGEKSVSSFQALMVSTASRVGTGNIVGVSTALCLGGPGAVFWMWVIAIVGAASAFIESTLAQIYKRRDGEGGFYGGPAYYIEQALKAPWLAKTFAVFLIVTYAVGFNMLAAFNLQDTFKSYSFYQSNPSLVPVLVGLALAVLVGFVLMGGGSRILKLTSSIVPFMGVTYVIVALIVIAVHFKNIPEMFGLIFQDAFDFKAIFGGISGSSLIFGIKRGLYSNEAGVGSAPNAAAAASVSHPVKQGLVQTLSVYLDTILLCTATALMALSSGVERSAEVSGAVYIQNAISTVFGSFGPLFITFAMVLFAFTTLVGNLYYVDNALAFLNGKKVPSQKFMRVFNVFAVLVIFVGTIIPSDAAWAMADITMAGMTLINLPACLLLSGIVIKALKDYEKQRKAGKDPVFKAAEIGMDLNDVDYWK